jgi:hypothetical protein
MNNIEAIYNKIETLASPYTTNFVIQGGYFESSVGFDDFSTNTLRMAINLGKLITKVSKRNNVLHSLLINDLGQACSPKGCTVAGNTINNTDVNLPDIANIIRDTGLNNNLIAFSTEKTLKNRGLRKIRKILKNKASNEELYPSLYSLVEDDVIKLYLSSKYGSDILVASVVDNNYIAKCPLIMGSYYSDMFLYGYFEKQHLVNNIFVIDFCSFTDKDKVIKGAEVSLSLFNQTAHPNITKTIMPIFCDTHCKKMMPLEIY